MVKLNMFSLKNRIALVTGGTGHLGKAICEALVKSNSIVYVASRKKNEAEKVIKIIKNEASGKLFPIELDISNESSIKKAIKQIKKEQGHIDILINNAGYGSDGDFNNKNETEWSDGLDGTINGVFRVCKQVLPLMKKKKHGVIINIGSMYGIISPDLRIYDNEKHANSPEYGAGKAAIIQFTKYLAVNYAKNGIRVNSISPGAFPNKEVQKNKKFIKKLKSKIPLERLGKPEDLMGVIIFLASEDSSYVTGQNILVDGGWSIW
jgi:NAD(P)-dependent dehydrogenase (short-subunit alcohol dehydrogenase family)